ncbi:MAG: hypothetical protein ABJH04_08185 [Cyclobacteriaceae bacterium]
MDKFFVKISKNDFRKDTDAIFDIDNTARFIDLATYRENLGEPEHTYQLMEWPDTAILREHPQFDELAFETEVGFMVPLDMVGFIPSAINGTDHFNW